MVPLSVRPYIISDEPQSANNLPPSSAIPILDLSLAAHHPCLSVVAPVLWLSRTLERLSDRDDAANNMLIEPVAMEQNDVGSQGE